MKKISVLLAMVILFVAAFISGCGSSAGDEFIGTWEFKTKTPNETFYVTIEKKSDKNFVINSYVKAMVNNKMHIGGSVHTAEVKDKILITDENRVLEIKDESLIYHDKNILYKKIDKNVLSKEDLFNR